MSTVPMRGRLVNNGLSPAEPMLTLQQVLDTYDVEPGDTIFVDAGVYSGGANVSITSTDGGAPTNAVIIQGSTSATNKTIFTGHGIRLEQVEGVDLSYLHFQSSVVGVNVLASTYINLEWCSFTGMANAGLLADGPSKFLDVRHSLFDSGLIGVSYQGSDSVVEHCVFYNNSMGMDLRSIGISAWHNIFYSNSEQLGYRFITESIANGIVSDYNAFYMAAGAYPVSYFSGASYKQVENVARWIRDFNKDEHSLSSHPSFADPLNGDFHLKSTEGRYEEGIGWVTDATSSLLIDSGDTSSMIATNEPTPNGGRVNIGLYGGTDEASKTPSGLAGAWLNWTYPNDGGRLEGVGRDTMDCRGGRHQP